MNDFTYLVPTKVAFGRNAIEKIVPFIREGGYKSVLLHYGGQSAIKSGLIEKMRGVLTDAKIAFCELGGVQPNPRLSLVEKGILLGQSQKCDLILAVGGGSVIDSAKAIGLGLANGGEVWDFYCKKRVPAATVAVGAVVTIAAAGSETSNSSVITNDSTGEKRGLNSEIIRPAFAVMNPELTLTVPPYQTACGCADILMHTAERYFTGAETMKLTDALAESLMTTVIACSKTVMKEPQNYEARANLMWAGSLSHNALTGLGSDGGDWTVHALGHEISALFDAAHGAALTAVWGSWARYVCKNALGRFYKFAVQVMGVRPSGTGEELALKGIEAAEEWFKSMGLPTSLGELGIRADEKLLREMASRCAAHCGGGRGSCLYLREEDMYNVYKAAL